MATIHRIGQPENASETKAIRHLAEVLPANYYIFRMVTVSGKVHVALRKEWRRGRDSNPRYPCGHTGFRNRPIQPLWHLSERAWASLG